MSEVFIRLAAIEDKGAIWAIMEPIIRAGETYALDANMTEEEAMSYWFLSNHFVYVALEGVDVVGTYFICNNQKGNGNHVSNCGYMVSQKSFGISRCKFVILFGFTSIEILL